nr:integrator complex subunit 8-like [Cherax quadricarinatus]
MNEQYNSALAGYLTAVFVATDFLRNDNGGDQCVLTDGIIRRMIRCCMNLNCYTQAAILCQFLENIDYSTALRCLQERNSVDAMDAYYCCLWDVSLIEFIINMHQKRGEIQRRDKAVRYTSVYTSLSFSVLLFLSSCILIHLMFLTFLCLHLLHVPYFPVSL